MLRACEYCVGRGEKVFGHYDRTDQKYFGHCAKNSVNDRQMTEKKNLALLFFFLCFARDKLLLPISFIC